MEGKGRTLINVHLQIEIRKEELPEVEQAHVHVSAAHSLLSSAHTFILAIDKKDTTHLLMIFSISSSGSGFFVS